MMTDLFNKVRYFCRSIAIFWIPNKSQLSEEQLAKETVYASSILCYFIGAIGFYVCLHFSFGLTEQGREIANLITLGMAGSALFGLIIFRVLNNKPLSISAMLLVIAWVAFFTTFSLGGIRSPSVMLFVIIPIAGIVLGGVRLGIIWAVICISTLFFIHFYMSFDQNIIQIIPEHKYNLGLTISWSCSVFSTSVIVAWYQLTTNKMQRKLNENNNQLQHIATHDALTHLPNRLYFNERINLLCNKSKPGSKFSLLILDLNGFKQINDTYGHGTGDIVLQNTAKQLKSALRESDFVARLGGDEFAVIIEKINSENELLTIQEKLRAAVKKPIEIRKTSHQVFTSIGMSTYPENGNDCDNLIDYADKSMYRNKEESKLSAAKPQHSDY